MENRKIHEHFTAIIERIWKFIAALFAIFSIQTVIDIIREITANGSADILGYIVAIGTSVTIIIALLGVVQFIKWRKTWITITDDLIIIEKNTINASIEKIAIENISSVNLEWNIFEQMVGTCKIKIDFNNVSSLVGTDITWILSEENAREFKDIVLKKMKHLREETFAETLKDGRPLENGETAFEIGDEVFTEVPSRDGAFVKVSENGGEFTKIPNIEDNTINKGKYYRSKKYTYGIKELVQHCFYRISDLEILMLLAALIVICAFVIGNIKIEDVLDVLKDLSGGVIVFLIAILYPALVAGIKSFLKYYGLSIYREGETIFAEHGLLKKEKYIIPIDKIDMVTIEQPAMSRIFKKYYIMIYASGIGQDEIENNDHIILALSKDETLKRFEELLPEYYEENILDDIIHQERKVMSIYFARWLSINILFLLTLCTVSYILNHIFGNVYSYKWNLLIGLVIGILTGIANISRYKIAGYKLYEDKVVFKNPFGLNSFGKYYSIIKYHKIQYLKISAGVVARKINKKTAQLKILTDISYGPYIEGAVYEMIAKRII